MTDTPIISPERNAAAQQVGAMFNSVAMYLNTLHQLDADGKPIMTEQLRNAYARVQEAGNWACLHVLNFGVPPVPEKPAEAPETPPSGVQLDLFDPAS